MRPRWGASAAQVRRRCGSDVAQMWLRCGRDTARREPRRALNDAPLKYARSTTPFEKSAPSNLAPGAYAFESCDSLKFVPEKSPFSISAPDRSKPPASVPLILHSRRSYSSSRAALACRREGERRRRSAAVSPGSQHRRRSNGGVTMARQWRDWRRVAPVPWQRRRTCSGPSYSCRWAGT